MAPPDLEKYSNWLKLIRITGWIDRRRFISKIMMLKKDREVNKSSKLYDFSPFIYFCDVIYEKEMMRMKGRIILACVADENITNPVIPPKRHFTELLVEHFHKEHGHAGQDYIVNQ